jgi:glycerate kinase
VQLLAAPDKLRGSLTAAEAARAIAAGAASAGWSAHELPLADGGEGTLDALGGPNRATRVTGPLGGPIEAPWRLDGGLAVIETALASGLALAGGAEGNDPIAATTTGTGELIAAALDAGASRIVVGVGGSATTDGGLGAVEVLRARAPFAVPVEIACDVTTLFTDAAAVFAPQKGATEEQVRLLAERLRSLAARYRSEFGIDIDALPGAGAAGGLAGGLAALGATLTPGFELVAAQLDLDGALERAALVVTAEGAVDATSFDGKVVGGVIAHARTRGVPVLVVAGEVRTGAPGVELVSLVERFGSSRAWHEPAACITEVVAAALEDARSANPNA